MTDKEFLESLELRIEELRTQRDSYAAQLRYHNARAERIEQEADVRIYELNAEVARLRECYEAALARNLDVREILNRLIAENTRLREALEPFAKAADKADASSETAMRLVGSGHSDDCTPGWGINYGHVKAARAALERTP